MQQNKVKQQLQLRLKTIKWKHNNGIIEEVKDFKPVIIEKEHVKIVGLWAIIENNAHKDLGKLQQNIQ
jgi:hypothetical protein